ncbi:Hypothetical predicted protein [Pelobates cultripes]|uniref:Uncharacterized protein n=1 Tax=Pelobates cultripes TaxID=61616 RepID=A0AAD1S2K7_PELCU|nr:Hypothetical predicted protein [Pelobates cultripes]
MAACTRSSGSNNISKPSNVAQSPHKQHQPEHPATIKEKVRKTKKAKPDNPQQSSSISVLWRQARFNMSTNITDYADDGSDISDDFTSGADMHHSPVVAPSRTHPPADTSPVTTAVMKNC